MPTPIHAPQKNIHAYQASSAGEGNATAAHGEAAARRPREDAPISPLIFNMLTAPAPAQADAREAFTTSNGHAAQQSAHTAAAARMAGLHALLMTRQ